MTNDHDDGSRLLHAVDEQLELLRRAQAIAVADIARLAGTQKALGYHPNHLGYMFGGDFASRGMGAAHILPLAGWHRLPFGTAINRLADHDDAGGGDLLAAVRAACESDQSLEAAGFAWLDDVGALKRGAVDHYWLKRPALGLGQPARLHGLDREHHDAHRGLYALDLADLRDRFTTVATGASDTSFGGLLIRAIEAGGPVLAALGTAVIHQDAKQRYQADALSFADYQRATTRREWRFKPPLSAQGHLARRTADARGIKLPAAGTRGGAADWLDETGANIRFRED